MRKELLYKSTEDRNWKAVYDALDAAGNSVEAKILRAEVNSLDAKQLKSKGTKRTP